MDHIPWQPRQTGCLTPVPDPWEAPPLHPQHTRIRDLIKPREEWKKLPCSTRELFSHLYLEKNSDIFAEGITHLLSFGKLSDLEHLPFSAHRATSNVYKNYLQLPAKLYDFEGKHNNNNNNSNNINNSNNNNKWCHLKLCFNFESYAYAPYNPWQQVIILSHNKIQPVILKGRPSILLVSLTVVNKF